MVEQSSRGLIVLNSDCFFVQRGVWLDLEVVRGTVALDTHQDFQSTRGFMNEIPILSCY